jgi:hypothetical protein
VVSPRRGEGRRAHRTASGPSGGHRRGVPNAVREGRHQLAQLDLLDLARAVTVELLARTELDPGTLDQVL